MAPVTVASSIDSLQLVHPYLRTQLMPGCVWVFVSLLCVCYICESWNMYFACFARVCVSTLDLCAGAGAERNSRERERGSTLAVPEQQRPVQHRSRSVSPHREDTCRARSRPAHVPMQRWVTPGSFTCWTLSDDLAGGGTLKKSLTLLVNLWTASARITARQVRCCIVLVTADGCPLLSLFLLVSSC